ncbi:MAG TPA: neocarzinostatin apoprotein domain-containing protein [Acidimicrobiia bacterium]|nr:neocarzinostatin apoprotein domain-containing protein [Acidimicrobiia bacterium]
MRRILCGAAALLMAGFGLVSVAAPAGAAMTVTASPGTGLSSGDVMTISGGGFNPGQTVNVYECVGSYQPALGSKLDATQCDTTAADSVETSVASDGSISTSMFFQSPLLTPSTPSGYDCSNGCTVVADPPPNVDAMTTVKGDNACNGNSGAVGMSTKSITLEGKTYTSDPGNLTAKSGDTVSVTIGWSTSLFKGNAEQVWDCVYFGSPPGLGGTDLGQPYDTFEKPATTEPFVTSFVVHAAWAGQDVCDRGRVSGMPTGSFDGTQKSNQFCFFVQPAGQVAEAPWPVLLGVVGIVVGAAFVIFQLRRRGLLFSS